MEQKTDVPDGLSKIICKLQQSQIRLSLDKINLNELSESHKEFVKEILGFISREGVQPPGAQWLQQMMDRKVDITEIATVIDLALAHQHQNIANQTVSVNIVLAPQHQNITRQVIEYQAGSAPIVAPCVATESTTRLLIESVRKYYSTDDKALLRTVLENDKESYAIREAYINLAIVKKEPSPRSTEKQKSNLRGDNQAAEIADRRMLSSYEQIYGKKEAIEISKLFSPLSNHRGHTSHQIPSKILIEGWAGIGKSVLCQYLANTWANPSQNVNQRWWHQSTEIVLWIPLRNLIHYDPENCCLGEVIRRECFGIQDAGNLNYLSAAQIEADLAALDDKVVLLLDGFDEVADWYQEVKEGKKQELSARSHLLNHILLGSRNNHRIIMTSRPNRVTAINQQFDNQLEIIGFTDENINQYVNRYFEKMPERGAALLSTMRSNTNLWGISHIPVNLGLVCLVWKEIQLDTKTPEFMTMTQLYSSVVLWLLRRDWEKHPVDQKGNDALMRKLDASQRRINAASISLIKFENELAFYPERLSVLRKIAWLAQTSPHQSILISGTAVKEVILQCYPAAGWPFEVQNELEKLQTLGLLESQDNRDEVPIEKNQYYFPHLTFQEYFAAKQWVAIFKDNKTKIVAKDYLLTHKYNPKDEVMWWFVAGLLKDEPIALSEYLTMFEQEPRDIIGLYHDTLMIRCHEESALQAEGHEDFIRQLGRKMRSILKTSHPERQRKIFFQCLSQSPRIFQHKECNETIFNLLGNGHGPLFEVLGEVSLPPVILNTLLIFFKDKDHSVRRMAAVALGGQSALSETILMRVGELCGDKDADVRRGAVEALGRQTSLPKTILMRLGDLFEDDDPLVRSCLVVTLGRQSSLPESILRTLVRLWLDENEDIYVRVMAAEALRGQSPLLETILERLVHLCGHPETIRMIIGGRPVQEVADVRRRSVRALACISPLPETILKRLVDLCGDIDAGVQRMAARALSGQPSLPETILKRLVDLCGDVDAGVQKMAARALGGQSLLPEWALIQLVALLNLKSREFVETACQGLINQPFQSLIKVMINRQEQATIVCPLMQIILERCLNDKIPVYCDLKEECRLFIGLEFFCFAGKKEKNNFIHLLTRANQALTGEAFHSESENVNLLPNLETETSPRFFPTSSSTQQVVPFEESQTDISEMEVAYDVDCRIF